MKLAKLVSRNVYPFTLCYLLPAGRSSDLIFFYFILTACKKKRNYILDQTNVYASARKSKMSKFSGFIRRAAVIVPDNVELTRRSEKRTLETGGFCIVAFDTRFCCCFKIVTMVFLKYYRKSEHGPDKSWKFGSKSR